MTNRFYVTFGQNHAHPMGAKWLDKDTVAVIHCPTEMDAVRDANRMFGRHYCRVTDTQPDMKWYPKGLVEL